MTKPPTPSVKSHQNVLEEAVSRALRDNLIPLQRNLEDLQQAHADLIAACSSSRPSNALPAMVRAQSASASLSAALAVLSNFVTTALLPRESRAGVAEAEHIVAAASTMEVATEERSVQTPQGSIATEAVEPPSEEIPAPVEHVPQSVQTAPASISGAPAPEPIAPVQAESEWATEAGTIDAAPVEPTLPVEADQAQLEPASVETEADAVPLAPETADAFDLGKLSTELQELHKRANRVAKVAMQDIKLLRPKDVRLGRENKDICNRLRGDLDKARKEYDRRFRAIMDHPVDYFHDWMVTILAEGDAEALGEYPYPSPVLHR